jgi:hypothetical protein
MRFRPCETEVRRNRRVRLDVSRTDPIGVRLTIEAKLQVRNQGTTSVKSDSQAEGGTVTGTDVRGGRFQSISGIAARAASVRPDSAPIRVSKRRF